MLLQPITVPFSKSTLKPSVYTLTMVSSQLFCLAGIFIHMLNVMFLRSKQLIKSVVN